MKTRINFTQIIRYIVVGVLTTIVGLTAYYGLVLTVLSPDNPIQLQFANVISWVLGVFFSYFANRKFVFKKQSDNIIKEICAFCVSRAGTLLLEMVGMFIMVTLLKRNDKIVKIILMLITTGINYICGKLWVFGGHDIAADN